MGGPRGQAGVQREAILLSGGRMVRRAPIRHAANRAAAQPPKHKSQGRDRVGITSIGPLPYAKGLSGAARAGRQQSRARGWSWVLVIACRTLVTPRGPGCAGETGRACPAMLESFLSTPLRAACPWTGSGPSMSLWMAAPVLATYTERCPNRAASEATSVFEACRRRF